MGKTVIVALFALPLAACSWGIKLDSGGSKVRTAWNDDVAACQGVGTVTVSVLDHVGPLDRNSLKVRDELEVMARNEAASLGADTIKPIISSQRSTSCVTSAARKLASLPR